MKYYATVGRIVLLAIEIVVYTALGLLGTVLFWMGFVALAGGNYGLSGLPFGALAGLVFLAVVYERNRGKNASQKKGGETQAMPELRRPG